MTREQAEAKPVLYPRDPSLDPQLVWKGKDEQDSQPLEVPSVPIYIQEKIHPQALIEDLRAFAAKERNEEQAQLFDDFNGLPLEQQIEFYRHANRWSNRMILGDSLLTMTSLAEREGLKGKVQMIYIDPPYGIKFRSNWQVSTRKRDVKDTGFDNVTRQPEQIKAFRDTWELGIHSYLAYLRDRLVVARELLTESGSLFIQIGDENVHLVRCLMDEVMGRENFVSQITFTKTTAKGSEYLDRTGDYLLWYGKSRENLKYRQPYLEKEFRGERMASYTWIEEPSGIIRRMTSDELNIGVVPDGCRLISVQNLTSQSGGESIRFPVTHQGQTFVLTKNYWKTNAQGMERLQKASRVIISGNNLNYVRYLIDFPVIQHTNLWLDTGIAGFSGFEKTYVVQTNAKVIERCLLMTTDPGDLVLDPTCGSGTTTYVAEQWGRRWITIETSRVALALARTRLMAAKYPYYLLADSQEGIAKQYELAGVQIEPRKTEDDVRKGFVDKTVPHVTLKSIANNDEIDVIHAKWQEKSEPLRAKINKLVGKNWEEWEIPRLSDSAIRYPKSGINSAFPKEAEPVIKEWWDIRRQRQKEIDASIARHADTETLYDQPYQDKKRVRVAGPFTVESLSPHRFLGLQGKRDFDDEWGVRTETHGPGEFESIILENLRKAGAQNTFKGERLKFDTLDVYPGQYIHGAGEITEKGGKTRRAAVCVGPEYGTVSPELIREAAKEAVKGVGFDILLVNGFNFDGMAQEETKHYGKLTVLLSKMAPELGMGDELLKKTGAGNLFMIVGEPDIVIRQTKDGKVEVEIKGMDVYDPTTGQVRSSSPDEIACWFIDTDYNEESFFVRHAYFTGADKPYERLRKTLKAEIDESAWSSLYSTVSRPFDPPKKGKIAVKVINHFGDEVLKVYEVK